MDMLTHCHGNATALRLHMRSHCHGTAKALLARVLSCLVVLLSKGSKEEGFLLGRRRLRKVPE